MNALATTPMAPRELDISIGEIPKELQEKLSAPLPPEAISANDKHSHLSSIKPAFVIERMNEVLGIGSYQERYREISVNTKPMTYNKGTDRERAVTLFVATVHGSLSIPKFGVYLENFGGSENEDAGDALKGACTDAFTKMCSHLGVGLEVYKGKHDKPKESDLPACPNCGKQLRKSKDGDGYYCWLKKDGCGATFTDEGLKAAIAAKNGTGQSAAKKAPAPAAAPKPAQSIDSEKITIANKIVDIREIEGRMWVTVGERKCTTMQEDLRRRFFGKKGHFAELLVAPLQTKEHGEIFQISKVIAIRSEREEAGHGGF